MQKSLIDTTWENIYKRKTQSHKNKYPNSEIVSFVLKYYYQQCFDNRKNIKVLDLGCGWGNNLNFLKNEGFDVYGIDGSKTAIDNCKTITSKVFVGSLNAMPFENGFFDMIIDRNSLQCNTFNEIEKIIQEVYRVLKKEGIFYSIMLGKTNHPEKFHAFYLENEKSILKREQIITLYRYFNKIEIDFLNESFSNEKLQLFNWKIIVRK